MAIVKQFKEASNKAEFILSPAFDKNMFSQLVNAEHITKDERQAIAAELVKNREQYDFDALILKLTDLCFTTKGSKFIREGSTDFLGDILQALADQTDGKLFVQECQTALAKQKGAKECAFPENYQFSQTLAHVFSLIKLMANKFALEKADESYDTNLGQNLINKVLFPLIINTGDPMQAATLITPFKTWAAAKAGEVGEYFSRHIPKTEDDSVKVNGYYETKKLHHDHAIESISNLIKDGTWSLGGFGLFKGGVTIEFDGQTVRVPHRVAAMAQLIKDYEQSDNKNVYELYENIRGKAQEALDTPRTGQKQSTRDFYQNVLDNLYVDKNVVTVEQKDEGEHQKLI